MPTALDREGYKYYLYSNEHMPEHVHVKNGSGKAKFDISDNSSKLKCNLKHGVDG